ncbi:hypothetical protein LTR12_017802 [Friedmanniomyces endolithicus]|nr:hypothetical protein LTR12_017802 [Friedmanniomyces endolithicus]
MATSRYSVFHCKPGVDRVRAVHSLAEKNLALHEANCKALQEAFKPVLPILATEQIRDCGRSADPWESSAEPATVQFRYGEGGEFRILALAREGAAGDQWGLVAVVQESDHQMQTFLLAATEVTHGESGHDAPAECGICFDVLMSTPEAEVLCGQCKVRLHEKYMYQWMENEPEQWGEDEEGEDVLADSARCPVCRHPWQEWITVVLVEE